MSGPRQEQSHGRVGVRHHRHRRPFHAREPIASMMRTAASPCKSCSCAPVLLGSPRPMERLSGNPRVLHCRSPPFPTPPLVSHVIRTRERHRASHQPGAADVVVASAPSATRAALRSTAHLAEEPQLGIGPESQPLLHPPAFGSGAGRVQTTPSEHLEASQRRLVASAPGAIVARQ